MRHGSLFSGIGGFELAAQCVGWENKFSCEINSFCRKVIQYYWPNNTIYEDITNTDFSIWRGKIDILTGGFPCQPFSVAGQRKGTGDNRYLWPEMLRAIREVEPEWVVAENVYGLISMQDGVVFEQVQLDLEDAGYEVQPFVVPACSVNAPHRRDRVWFVAHNSNARIESMQQRRENGVFEFRTIAHTKHDGLYGATGRRSDSEGNNKDKTWEETTGEFTGCCGKTIISCEQADRDERQECDDKQFDGCSGKWLNTWEQWPTEPPVCSRDDGFPGGLDGITFPKWRNESIKAYGNAIVPQVAVEIFRVIQQIDNLKI
jgi:DNA (cytosine-5)-methyltransferase 1